MNTTRVKMILEQEVTPVIAKLEARIKELEGKAKKPKKAKELDLE